MSKLFDDMMESLNEIIAYESGAKDTGVVVRRREIKDVPDFSPSEIREIRIKTKMTQVVFASCMGISVKTVEAWEGGRTHPDGVARRMLECYRNDPMFAEKIGLFN